MTLAIVDPKNPDWLISQFVRSGVVRTVTAENQGKFTETWDGLDDNFMPVPPGHYAVKGILMAADKWAVDNDFHSITPRFVTGASAWLPTPEQWNKPEPFGGDPVGQPLGAVAAAPGGLAVFDYVYLENGLNCPVLDLNKIIGYEQFIRAYNSGGRCSGVMPSHSTARPSGLSAPMAARNSSIAPTRSRSATMPAPTATTSTAPTAG